MECLVLLIDCVHTYALFALAPFPLQGELESGVAEEGVASVSLGAVDARGSEGFG